MPRAGSLRRVVYLVISWRADAGEGAAGGERRLRDLWIARPGRFAVNVMYYRVGCRIDDLADTFAWWACKSAHEPVMT